MKALLLFPFRVIAFCIRMVLWIVMIPLIICIRILEVAAPEIMRPLRQGITTLINIFRFCATRHPGYHYDTSGPGRVAIMAQFCYGYAPEMKAMPADSYIHFLPRNSPSTSAGKSTVTQAAKHGMQEPAPLPRLYREVYKASGLSRMEIRSRLAWSNNASKMLRFLDFLLDGKCPDPEFEQRFIKVMEIPHDVLARVRQQQAEWENRRNEEKLAAQVKREFIGYGSRLVVLPNRDYKPQTFFGRWGMHLGCRLPLDMAYYPDNQPPTREDMARCIASMDPSLKAMLPLPVHMIGGFIYYRLPGETWSYDVNGNLAGYGDTHAVLPEGSLMI